MKHFFHAFALLSHHKLLCLNKYLVQNHSFQTFCFLWCKQILNFLFSTRVLSNHDELPPIISSKVFKPKKNPLFFCFYHLFLDRFSEIPSSPPFTTNLQYPSNHLNQNPHFLLRHAVIPLRSFEFLFLFLNPVGIMSYEKHFKNITNIKRKWRGRKRGKTITENNNNNNFSKTH